MPRDLNDYFRSIEAKHFNQDSAVGSYFTDPEIDSLADLVERAAAEPGGLERDDRALFNEEALRPDCRYLRVRAEGKNNLISTADLEDDTEVEVVRTKKEAPCSLVVSDTPERNEDFATLIIGPRPEGGGECVWTAHPGAPVKAAQEDIWPEGSRITVADVRAKLGQCWLQGR